MARPVYVITMDFIDLDGHDIRHFVNVVTSRRTAIEVVRRLNYGIPFRSKRKFYFYKCFPDNWSTLDLHIPYPPTVAVKSYDVYDDDTDDDLPF